MYNEESDYAAKEETDGKLLIIRPEESLPVSRVERNPEKLRLAYEIGRTTALKRLNEVRNYLEE